VLTSLKLLFWQPFFSPPLLHSLHVSFAGEAFSAVGKRRHSFACGEDVRLPHRPSLDCPISRIG
jgi:hypothetical protein